MPDLLYLLLIALIPGTLLELFSLYRALRVRSFLPAEGQLISFEPSHNDSGDIITSARIIYRYSAQGEEHESTRLGIHPSPARLDQLANAFRTGQKIEVFYNPATPSQSVLFKGIGPGLMLGLVGCTLLWLFFAAYFSGLFDYLTKIGILEEGGHIQDL
jgi:hypothetical protein